MVNLRVFVAVSWGIIGTYQQVTREKGDGYKPSAEVVQQIAQDEDSVLVDGTLNYWCFLWYYVGPNWGEPRHAFILNPDWERLMERLPQGVSGWLSLNDIAAVVHRGRVTAILWDRSKPVPETPGGPFRRAPTVVRASLLSRSAPRIESA